MHPELRVRTTFALFLLVAAGLSAASITAEATRVPAKPVIGEPVTVPAQPQAGKRFAISFRVTRSDTGKPLMRGKMICDPSVGGKAIPHAESFRQGTARLSFVVPTVAAGRSLKVKLTISAGGQSATRVANFRILRGEVASLVSIGDASVAEGNAGITTLSFAVTLSPASAKSASVDFTTADGTATAPTDYKSVSGTLSFKPGERAKTLALSVIGDTTLEQDETLTVTLSNPVKATIANATATGTITNDDVATQPVQVLLGTYCGFTTAGGGICFDVAATGTAQYVTHVKYKQTTKNEEDVHQQRHAVHLLVDFRLVGH